MKLLASYVWLALVVWIISGLVMVGCGGDADDSGREPDVWYAITVPAPDGGPVLCITNDLENAITCDWAGR